MHARTCDVIDRAGVPCSNFSEKKTKQLLGRCRHAPAVNQVGNLLLSTAAVNHGLHGRLLHVVCIPSSDLQTLPLGP